MIVLVDEKLAAADAQLQQNPHLTVIKYKRKLPIHQVINVLQQLSSKQEETHLDFLKNMKIQFTEPIVTYKSIAEQTGFNIEAIKKHFCVNTPQGYTAAANCLIREDEKARLKNTLATAKPASLKDAYSVLQREGVPLEAAEDILKEAGYKIRYTTLNPAIISV